MFFDSFSFGIHAASVHHHWWATSFRSPLQSSRACGVASGSSYIPCRVYHLVLGWAWLFDHLLDLISARLLLVDGQIWCWWIDQGLSVAQISSCSLDALLKVSLRWWSILALEQLSCTLHFFAISCFVNPNSSQNVWTSCLTRIQWSKVKGAIQLQQSQCHNEHSQSDF